MMPGHRCPAPGCHVQISPAQLACRPHWRAIPWSIRARILREFHRRPGSSAHLAAAGDGIRFLGSLYVAAVVDQLDEITGPDDAGADLVEVRTDERT